jgi:acyl-CoA synthetase (AMP-forming)/AMP-acid ligase II
MNLATLLARSAVKHPERTAITDLDAPGGRTDISYRDLWRQVQHTAQALHALGLRPGDRVAMLLGNSWEYVQTFMAITSGGMVAVPMNIRLLEDELLHIVKDSGASLLVAQHALLHTRPGLRGVAPLGEVIVRPIAPLDENQRPFEALVGTRGAPEPEAVSDDHLAVIAYTSGTTGAPKGTMLAHRTWRVVSEYSRSLLAFAADEVTIHTAALTHGSGYLLLPTMEVGGRALLCAKFDPGMTLQWLRDERVTSGFMVPSMIQMLLDAHGDRPPLRDLDLRALYYAGSPIPPSTLADALDTFGDVLIQSFGQTESPMFLTAMGHEDHRRINTDCPHLIRAAGRAVPGVTLRIVDDEGHDVAPGEPGEVVARGPHVMLGYWNRPQATAETLAQGWLHTGDIGRLDAQGYLYIVDRKKDMIISGGSNVYAREVEEVLQRAPGIKEAAVIGLPHPKWGEMVVAVLVPQEGAALSETELESFCRREIADYRRPKAYFHTKALPRNAYGKVLKRELRDRLDTLATPL